MPDVPYFPSKRYVEKNLRGETALKPHDFVALSFAQKRAVEQGVLTPELAKYMIPMAITEGWSNNYGVKGDTALYASKDNVERFKKMGLSVVDATKVPEDKPMPYADAYIQKVKGEPHVVLNSGGYDDPSKSARVMAVVLSSKASLKGVTTPEDAVKRYNGKGKALEELYGETVPANVDVYLSKVKEAQEMMKHPANAPLNNFLTNVGALQ